MKRTLNRNRKESQDRNPQESTPAAYEPRPLDAVDVMLAHVYGGIPLVYGPWRSAF